MRPILHLIVTVVSTPSLILTNTSRHSRVSPWFDGLLHDPIGDRTDPEPMLVSHDVGAISRHVQRVACLNRRLFVHAASELTGEVLERIYGRPLTLLDHDHSGPAR